MKKSIKPGLLDSGFPRVLGGMREVIWRWSVHIYDIHNIAINATKC